MKLEIIHNGEVIDSLSAGQTAIIPKEKEFVSDIVIRAVADVSLISFTIAGTTYYAEEGMTWAEWCESEYVPEGVTAGINTSVNADTPNYRTVVVEGTTLSDGNLVYAWHTIVADCAYTHHGHSPTPV